MSEKAEVRPSRCFFPFLLLCILSSLALTGCATTSKQFDAESIQRVRVVTVATNIFLPEKMEFPAKKKSQVKPEGLVDGAASAIGRTLFRFEQVDPEEEMRERTDIDELVRSSVHSAFASNLAECAFLEVSDDQGTADAVFFLSVDRIGLMDTAFSEFTAGMKPFMQITCMLVAGQNPDVVKVGEPDWMKPNVATVSPVIWKATKLAYGTGRARWTRGYYYRHFTYEPELLRSSLRADAARACDALIDMLQEDYRQTEETGK